MPEGADAYNLDLSRRRAAAVQDYLAGEQQVAGNRLVAAGFGETVLKNPRRPGPARTAVSRFR